MEKKGKQEGIKTNLIWQSQSSSTAHVRLVGAMGFMPVWRYHQLPSGYLANGHLPPRMSCHSHLSDDNNVNEVKPGSVHRSPGIYLMTEENLS